MFALCDRFSVLENLEPRLLMASGAMIVTSEALAGAFQDVADWYTRKGHDAVVVTTESIASIIMGFIGPTDTRKLAIVGNDTEATVLKSEIFANAACWQGYKILEGLVPVLRTNQIVLARAKNIPSIYTSDCQSSSSNAKVEKIFKG